MYHFDSSSPAAPPPATRGRRSTRSVRGWSSKRNASRRNQEGGATSSAGPKRRLVKKAKEHGPARKWVQVMRPPATNIRFEVPTWVPWSELTDQERQNLLEQEEEEKRRQRQHEEDEDDQQHQQQQHQEDEDEVDPSYQSSAPSECNPSEERNQNAVEATITPTNDTANSCENEAVVSDAASGPPTETSAPEKLPEISTPEEQAPWLEANLEAIEQPMMQVDENSPSSSPQPPKRKRSEEEGKPGMAAITDSSNYEQGAKRVKLDEEHPANENSQEQPETSSTTVVESSSTEDRFQSE